MKISILLSLLPLVSSSKFYHGGPARLKYQYSQRLAKRQSTNEPLIVSNTTATPQISSNPDPSSIADGTLSVQDGCGGYRSAISGDSIYTLLDAECHWTIRDFLHVNPSLGSFNHQETPEVGKFYCVSPPPNLYSGAWLPHRGCKKYHIVQSGETCQSIAQSIGDISVGDLRRWNLHLNCNNLLVNHAYCSCDGNSESSPDDSSEEPGSIALLSTPSPTVVADPTSTPASTPQNLETNTDPVIITPNNLQTTTSFTTVTPSHRHRHHKHKHHHSSEEDCGCGEETVTTESFINPTFTPPTTPQNLETPSPVITPPTTPQNLESPIITTSTPTITQFTTVTPHSHYHHHHHHHSESSEEDCDSENESDLTSITPIIETPLPTPTEDCSESDPTATSLSTNSNDGSDSEDCNDSAGGSEDDGSGKEDRDENDNRREGEGEDENCDDESEEDSEEDSSGSDDSEDSS